MSWSSTVRGGAGGRRGAGWRPQRTDESVGNGKGRSRRFSPRLAALTLLVVFEVLLLACTPIGWNMGDHHRGMHGGNDTRAEPRVEASGTVSVEIKDYAFRPGNLEVTAGTSVTWVNRDDVPHTATAVDESWNTGRIDPGKRGTITFAAAGVYEYFCLPHPDMKARIVVVEAAVSDVAGPTASRDN